ncbi:MAG: hypothetical protein HY922_16635 [Elusimicrobia bacterium]|nr:hypothetical protein [Elusimicrobiota bacterium]
MTGTSSRKLPAFLALSVLSGALACADAQAQFSFPYDPDFASQAPERPAPALQPEKEAAAPAEQPAARPPEALPEMFRSAGPFLLLERKDPARIFETAPSCAAPKDFAEFLKTFEPFKFDPSRWDKMREDVEYGVLPREEIELPTLPPPSPYELAGSSAAPAPPRPEIELPTYGTSLSITGRKVIGFSFTEKRYLGDQSISKRPKSTNLIDIQQQLQLRMQGKVGPKITVNVDYDDTKANKQDISVVYTGDPNEVVQNASFGDIDLSLPATEFVSYNKQLFGIRIQLKYKKLSAIFIGSRTKGTTKTKQFRGNTQLTNMDILDTSYIRRQYYDISFDNLARLPIKAGSEKVYLSRKVAGQQNVGEVTLTVDDLSYSTVTYTGTFTQLIPGADYTVDYAKGILTFRNSLDAQDVVAVDFTDASGTSISVQTSTASGTSGGTGRNKLIKTFADAALPMTPVTTIYNFKISSGTTPLATRTFQTIGISTAEIKISTAIGSPEVFTLLYAATAPVTSAITIGGSEESIHISSCDVSSTTVSISPTPFPLGIFISTGAATSEITKSTLIYNVDFSTLSYSTVTIHVEISTRAESQAGYDRELKTFYNIGRSQIMRDDGRGNFALNVLDLNRNPVGPSLNPMQKYPDTITVDFENGVFRLEEPFAEVYSSTTPDHEVYSPTPITKRLFQLELRFRMKTFYLEPNLVLQSEVVLIDGVRLNRNSDYFVDYESGFITFFNEDRIKESSVIDVSYEVAPFVGSATESLLGTRIGYDFNEHFSIGSTLLYQTGSKPPTVPTVTELAKSLLVYEADMQLKNVKFLPFLQGTFAGELARSHMNPNLSKLALIDNMEGVKQDDNAPMIDASWQIASNPAGEASKPGGGGLTWVTGDVKIRDINTNAPVGPDETQKILNLNYNFTVQSSTKEVSIVYPFSATGLDFSQKTMLEVVVNQSSKSLNEINFHLGGISEDADGAGGMTLTCADNRIIQNAPKTEDLNCDGILQPDEDKGWAYAPAGKTDATYGAGNGRIDSEDLNRNGRLDPADLSGGDFGYAALGDGKKLYDVTSGSTRTALDFAGWHTFQIPISIARADVKWNAIKQLRITVHQGAGGASSGFLQFARIAAIGNTWQRGQAGDPATGAVGGGTVTVKSVNNADDPGYLPIYRAGGDAEAIFYDLYGSADEIKRQSNSSNIAEGALELRFSNLPAGATVYTKRTFSRALDISQHRSFTFLLYGNAQGTDISPTPTNVDKTFFLRAGSDKDYFEIQVPLAFTGWQKIVAEQADINNDQIPDIWRVGQGPGATVVVSTGRPNLQQIAVLTAGVYSSGATTTAGALWLDEIHLADPIKQTGQAQKLQADFTIPGWGTLGAKHRFVDRRYQTPTTVVSNQDNRQENAYLNLDRLSFLPMHFTLARTITVTPNTNAVGDRSNLVSLMQQGKVTTYNGTANGAFSYGAWPRLSLSHTRDRKDYQELTRLDDRKTYAGSLDYTPPAKRWLPQSIGLTASRAKNSVSFESQFARSFPGNYDTDEFTNAYGARLNFTPWAGSSFNPNYAISTVKEDRRDFSSGPEIRDSYMKSMNQTAGLTANFPLLRWFNPSVNYSLTTTENYILQPTRIVNNTLAVISYTTYTLTGSTDTFGIGAFKTVNRQASGGINLTLAASEIIPKSKLLRSASLSNSYQLQDGDVYNNVEGGLNTRGAFWIRTPLRARSPAAQRANLTLRDTFNSSQRWSPLEAYDITGRKAAFKTFAVTNNYTQSIQRSEVTGTLSKTVSTTLPDLIASLSQIERLLYADRWMRNGQINLKYSAHRTENVGQSLDTDGAVGTDLRALIRERYDAAVSFNHRTSAKRDLRIDQIVQTTDHKDATIQSTFDLRTFRFTPKLDYQQDITALGTGVQTQNTTVLTPSLLVRTDIALPKGLRIPFSEKTLAFTNRVIWTTTLSLAMRQSPVTLTDNSKLFNLNTSADYEIAKNLRMTLNGAVSRFWHKYLKEEEYISYLFGTMLTFQF